MWLWVFFLVGVGVWIRGGGDFFSGLWFFGGRFWDLLGKLRVS